MSFFDEEVDGYFKKFDEEVKAKFAKKEEKDKILTEVQIPEIRKEAKAFLKAQMRKDRDDRECFYVDEFNYEITFFKLDDEPKEKAGGVIWNAPQYYDKKKPTEATVSVIYPLSEGRINVKMDRRFLKYNNNNGTVEWGSKVVARGDGWYQYHPIEQVEVEVMQEGAKVKVLKDVYQFDKQFIATMSKLDGKKYNNLSEIDKSQYTRHPGFRVFQILEEVK